MLNITKKFLNHFCGVLAVGLSWQVVCVLALFFFSACSDGVVTSRSGKDSEKNKQEAQEEADDEVVTQEDLPAPVDEEEVQEVVEEPEDSDTEESPVVEVADGLSDGVLSDGALVEVVQHPEYVTVFRVGWESDDVVVQWNVPENFAEVGIADYQYQIEGGAVAWQSLGKQGTFSLSELDLSQDNTLIVRVLYEEGPGETHVIHLAAKDDVGTPVITVKEPPKLPSVVEPIAMEEPPVIEPPATESPAEPEVGDSPSLGELADSGMGAEVVALPSQSVERIPVVFYVDPRYTSLKVSWTLGEGPETPKIVDYQYRMSEEEQWKSMLSTQGEEELQEEDEEESTYYILNLTPATSYKASFRVVYEDVASLATTMEFITLSESPEDRERLTVTIEARSTELWLSWQQPQWLAEEDVEDFEYRIKALGENWLSLGKDGSHLITGLTSSTDYMVEVRVRYVDGVGRAVAIPFTTRSEGENR